MHEINNLVSCSVCIIPQECSKAHMFPALSKNIFLTCVSFLIFIKDDYWYLIEKFSKVERSLITNKSMLSLDKLNNIGLYIYRVKGREMVIIWW